MGTELDAKVQAWWGQPEDTGVIQRNEAARSNAKDITREKWDLEAEIKVLEDEREYIYFVLGRYGA